MQFSVLQENLLPALKIVGRAVVNRSTLPVLSNVLLETAGDGLIRLTANNFNVAITTVIGGKIEDTGAITLPHKILSEVVAGLPPERIDFKLDPETMSMRFKCANMTTKINGIDAGEFPGKPVVTGVEMALDYDLVKRLAGQVAVCAATDESRPVFTGIWFRLSPEGLTAAAADGFRLAKLESVEGHVPESEFDKVQAKIGANGQPFIETIIPAEVVEDFARIIEEEEPITMTVGDRHVAFTCGPTTVISNTINGDYPDVQRIIPATSPITVQMDSAMLVKAIRLAHMFSRDAANLMLLTIAPNAEGQYTEVFFTGKSAQTGDSVSSVPAHITGVKGQFEIGFNSKYMMDACNSINSTQTILKMNTFASPGILTGGGDNGKYLHIIMPMHLGR